MKIKQWDFCTGVGCGFPLAGVRLNHDIVGLTEIDAYCKSILKLRFPDARITDDVNKLVFTDCDIFSASPPCQPFSIRGKRLGKYDNRDCFPALIKQLTINKPRSFIFENVSGLLSIKHNSRYYVNELIEQIAEIGYTIFWETVENPGYKPWNRTRLFIYGFRKDNKNTNSDSIIIKCRDKQVRKLSKAIANYTKERGMQSELFRSPDGIAFRLDRSEQQDYSIGVCAKNRKEQSANRKRRIAIGNALDQDVAYIQLALISMMLKDL